MGATKKKNKTRENEAHSITRRNFIPILVLPLFFFFTNMLFSTHTHTYTARLIATRWLNYLLIRISSHPCATCMVLPKVIRHFYHEIDKHKILVVFFYFHRCCFSITFFCVVVIFLLLLFASFFYSFVIILLILITNWRINLNINLLVCNHDSLLK